ncbi:hypothetical protein NDU88_004990 [Pleurodeles waltl]|uniref:Uncharacterized protein n=1 Tax=Pleurodeles waltl TaxID=8319 RepID=A0AAV7UGQ8_PLEWA|nr:hypothetical protein NDU88_004990 [Pleurodeles waltl]
MAAIWDRNKLGSPWAHVQQCSIHGRFLCISQAAECDEASNPLKGRLSAHSAYLHAQRGSVSPAYMERSPSPNGAFLVSSSPEPPWKLDALYVQGSYY